MPRRVAECQLSFFDLGLADPVLSGALPRPLPPSGSAGESAAREELRDWRCEGERIVREAGSLDGWEAEASGHRAVFRSVSAGPGGVRARVEVSRNWEDRSLFLAACLERGEAVMEYSVWQAASLGAAVLGRTVERALRHCVAWNRTLARRARGLFGPEAVSRLADALVAASGAGTQLQFLLFRDFDLRRPPYEGGKPLWSELECFLRGLRVDFLPRQAPLGLALLPPEVREGCVLVLEDRRRAMWREHLLSQLVLGACAAALERLPPLPSWPFWDSGGRELPGREVPCVPFRPQFTVGEAIGALPRPGVPSGRRGRGN
ncbi:MAG: hypothetical protein AB1816_15470, partial [Bacillota bacterium]